MKRSTWSSLVVGLSCLSVLVLPGFVTHARGDEERNGAIGNDRAADSAVAPGGYAEKKEEFKRETRKTLAELDHNMAKLEAKAKETGATVKAKAKVELRDLEAKRATVKEDMENLEAASKEAWDAARTKVKGEIDDLERKYAKVRSEFE